LNQNDKKNDLLGCKKGKTMMAIRSIMKKIIDHAAGFAVCVVSIDDTDSPFSTAIMNNRSNCISSAMHPPVSYISSSPSGDVGRQRKKENEK
jgi:hypothetical protein